ncbi:hypothetical protein Cgig2_001870 [Carnegiea gigantea]|uniref:Uncharacterized protein n=1 Tax=Carnegiea gigantea TaxID=171969 RepID=A0A9Q1JZY0_9CARY|nr:hypothetical protein Cgig2_001870 [Carnegiea gigantea]
MAESIVLMKDNKINEDQSGLEGGATIHKILPFFTPLQKHNQGLSEQRQGGMSSKFHHWLGFEELFSPEVWRASLAELFGTGLLVFMIDTIVISSLETDTKTPNIVISCFVALLIAILLLATGPVSGGHINPAITLSATLVGLISVSRAIVYIIAQCIGAVVGALALKAIVSSSIANTFSLGGCTPTVVTPGPDGPMTVGLGMGQALWLEILCSFFFLFPVWMAFDHRQLKALGPVVVCSIIGIVVGLIVFISTTVTSKKGYAGVGINPARCIGPAIVRGGHLWTGHWVFWVGPIIASVVFYLYTVIIPSEHFKPRVIKE